MKKSGITSPSERRSPCREPAGNSAHSLKLTFVSNFLKERRTSILWLQKTAFFPIFCEIGKKIFWKSAPKPSMTPARTIGRRNISPGTGKRKITPERSASPPCRWTGLKKSEETLGPGYEDRFTPKPFEE